MSLFTATLNHCVNTFKLLSYNTCQNIFSSTERVVKDSTKKCCKPISYPIPSSTDNLYDFTKDKYDEKVFYNLTPIQHEDKHQRDVQKVPKEKIKEVLKEEKSECKEEKKELLLSIEPVYHDSDSDSGSTESTNIQWTNIETKKETELVYLKTDNDVCRSLESDMMNLESTLSQDVTITQGMKEMFFDTLLINEGVNENVNEDDKERDTLCYCSDDDEGYNFVSWQKNSNMLLGLIRTDPGVLQIDDDLNLSQDNLHYPNNTNSLKVKQKQDNTIPKLAVQNKTCVDKKQEVLVQKDDMNVESKNRIVSNHNKTSKRVRNNRSRNNRRRNNRRGGHYNGRFMNDNAWKNEQTNQQKCDNKHVESIIKNMKVIKHCSGWTTAILDFKK